MTGSPDIRCVKWCVLKAVVVVGMTGTYICAVTSLSFGLMAS